MATTKITSNPIQEATVYSGNLLNNNIQARRYGNVVSISLNGFKDLTVAQSNIVAVLDEQYRPSHTVTFNITFGEIYRIIIQSNGNVAVYPYTAVGNQNNIKEDVTYIK